VAGTDAPVSLTPQQLYRQVSAVYGEAIGLLPAKSWHCHEIAMAALAADRVTGGHGHLATGELRLPDGNTTQHCVFICGDPHGMVIDGHMGVVRLSERASLPLTLGMTGSRPPRAPSALPFADPPKCSNAQIGAGDVVASDRSSGHRTVVARR
jgi:hypothetical protein